MITWHAGGIFLGLGFRLRLHGLRVQPGAVSGDQPSCKGPVRLPFTTSSALAHPPYATSSCVVNSSQVSLHPKP